jgi:hypothetical protein
MNIYYAVLAAIVVAALVAVAYQLIKTLIQLQGTAREAEALVQKANAEMEKVGHVTSAVSGFAGVLGSRGGRLAATAANLAVHLIQRYRKRDPVEAGADDERD